MFKLIWILLLQTTLLGCSKQPLPGPEEEIIGSEKPAPEGRKLYNGILLPEPWPPVRSYTNDFSGGMNPYYLTFKPDTIDISVGRQLFVDDFLIDQSTMKRTFHYPEYHSANPVFKPEREWEKLGTGGSAFAAPFSDGVWYDESDLKYKMWYMGGGGNFVDPGAGLTCYAESRDGITWTRPDLGVVAGTNISYRGKARDASTVWLDKQESSISKRFKMFLVEIGDDGKCRYIYQYSSDGKLWRTASTSQPVGDRSTVYQNSFRKRWIYSIRHNLRISPQLLIRARDYEETSDPEEGTREVEAILSKFWFGPWPGELRNPEYPEVAPAIYNLDAVPYESLMLGFFSVWQGPENDVADLSGRPKRNQIMVGYSRDGYSWHREDMNAFHPVSENQEEWNWGNIQSAAGSPLIVGDKLYFYMSGRTIRNHAEITSTGVATLRRDGFVSMDAGDSEAVLTTELIRFTGKYFYVNAEVYGALRIEVLDSKGNVLEGFSRDKCIPFSGNSVKTRISWSGRNDLAELEKKAVRIRFYLTKGALYSFWISPRETGESYGFTAGGGPDLHSSGIDK